MDVVVAVACTLFVSAVVHTTAGFGFAIVSVPFLAVLLEPEEVVATIVTTGVLVDVSVMTLSGRAPRPRWRDVVELGLWSVPGLALGGVGLRYLPGGVVEALMTAAVLVVVVQRVVAARRRGGVDEARGAAMRWWMAPSAGALSGALSTSTTLGGPPVVIYLNRKHRVPRHVRDTLVALSLVRLPLSVVTLVLTGTWVAPRALPVLWVAVAVGFAVGRVVFARLTPGAYERVTLGVLSVAAVGALGSLLAS